MPLAACLIWRTYGNDPLPTPRQALNEPLRRFPLWFLRVECSRCGAVQVVNEVHAPRRDLPIRTILARMRHEVCGGRVAKAELLSGVEAAVRRIVLWSP